MPQATSNPRLKIDYLAAASDVLAGRKRLRLIAKRVIDVVGASLFLILLAPVLVVVAVMVGLDGGQILYTHRRVGRGGQHFNCLKFRTMCADADLALAALLERDEALRQEWLATRKLRDDPRVTRVGRILRMASLDELPQLLNVLNGEMSLVGPRPVLQQELDTFYGPAAFYYLSVRPGITGLWQVNGRSDTDYKERVMLDVQYAKEISLRSDFWILMRTAAVVLKCRGAC
jgi:exopolysaccharide production protein ExoY